MPSQTNSESQGHNTIQIYHPSTAQCDAGVQSATTWGHRDLGIFSFVGLPSHRAPGSFPGCPRPGQYRGPERVEDKLCRNFWGEPSTDLCAFFLTYSTGQNSVTWAPQTAGAAGRCHLAARVQQGKESDSVNASHVLPRAPRSRPRGLGLSCKSWELGKQGRS